MTEQAKGCRNDAGGNDRRKEQRRGDRPGRQRLESMRERRVRFFPGEPFDRVGGGREPREQTIAIHDGARLRKPRTFSAEIGSGMRKRSATSAIPSKTSYGTGTIVQCTPARVATIR